MKIQECQARFVAQAAALSPPSTTKLDSLAARDAGPTGGPPPVSRPLPTSEVPGPRKRRNYEGIPRNYEGSPRNSEGILRITSSH